MQRMYIFSWDVKDLEFYKHKEKLKNYIYYTIIKIVLFYLYWFDSVY